MLEAFFPLTEPIDGVNGTFENSQESIDNPVSQPLGVIGRASGEQSIERVVGWKDEADGVDKELCGNVEENKEEVKCAESKGHIDL